MTYRITAYTKARAAELGVTVKPSSKQNKKIDVYRGSKLIASIGGAGYADYPTYIESHGRAHADERRRAFYARHAKSISVRESPAWWAAKLLW